MQLEKELTTKEVVTPYFKGNFKIIYEKPNFEELEIIKKPITSSLSAADALRSLIEYFEGNILNTFEIGVLITLNRANYITGFYKLGEGNVSSCVICIKKIAQATLLNHSTSIILGHNHPSGNSKPSKQDDNLTEDVKQGLKALDITLLDHIILTDTNFYSYADTERL